MSWTGAGCMDITCTADSCIPVLWHPWDRIKRRTCPRVWGRRGIATRRGNKRETCLREATSRIPRHKLQLFREPWLALPSRRCISHMQAWNHASAEGEILRITTNRRWTGINCRLPRTVQGTNARSISRAIDLRARSLCNFAICLSRLILDVDGTRRKKDCQQNGNKCSTIKAWVLLVREIKRALSRSLSRRN